MLFSPPIGACHQVLFPAHRSMSPGAPCRLSLRGPSLGAITIITTITIIIIIIMITVVITITITIVIIIITTTTTNDNKYDNDNTNDNNGNNNNDNRWPEPAQPPLRSPELA